jgi:arylformamidase
MTLYDISQTLDEKTAVWPGDQKFRLRWSMRIGQGDSCNVSAFTMSAHTGTHLDAPYHFDDSGADIASVPLEVYAGRARVLCVPAELTSISLDFLRTVDWAGVERILFRTAASDAGAARFTRDFAYLPEESAEFLAQLSLVQRPLVLVGTDAPSIDAFTSKTLSSHKRLLTGGIAILEGIRLAHVPPGDYELICLPLKLAGLDGSPVRAILRK